MSLIPEVLWFPGINAIMFYAPQLFSAFGNSQQWALRSTLIIGAVNVGSTIVSIVMVDRVGRKCALTLLTFHSDPQLSSPTIRNVAVI